MSRVPSSRSRGALTLNPTVITLVGIALVVIAIVAYFAWVGSYLGANLFSRDLGDLYTPLVRHVNQEQQVHCYDNGDDRVKFCETVLKPGFKKEYTIGYLFPRKKSGNQRLYSCAKVRGEGKYKFESGYDIVTDRESCVARDLRPTFLGYVADRLTVPEASVALHRCANTATKDVIVTDNPSDCSKEGYGSSEVLGYISASGTTMMARLSELCSNIKHDCGANYAATDKPLCAAAKPFCDAGGRVLLRPTTPPETAAIQPGISAIDVGGSNRACANKDGQVFCWRADPVAQGTGSLITDGSVTPDVLLEERALHLIEGFQHTCLTPVAGATKCWGKNEQYQRGDGTAGNTVTDKPDKPVLGLPETGVIKLAASDNRTCGIVSGGIKCWGGSSTGVRQGSTVVAPGAAEVEGFGPDSGVTDLAVGNTAICAIINGGVKCSGKFYKNEFGSFSSTSPTVFSSALPTTIKGLESGVTAITVGQSHACAIQGGALKCWGANRNGQLGNLTSVDQANPVIVSELTTNVTRVTAGPERTCASVGSKVMCWGKNQYQQLGSRAGGGGRPIEVENLSGLVKELSAGGLITCATIDSTVSCWGGNFTTRRPDGSVAPITVAFPAPQPADSPAE